MGRIPFYLILLFIISIKSFGQDSSLRGLIVDSEGPVPFASISIEKTTLGTNSEENGTFHLQGIPPGQQVVVISVVGYKQWSRELSFAEGGNVDLGRVEIEVDVLGLEKVVVTGTMKRTFLKDSPIKVEVITGKYLMDNRSPTNLVESIAMVNGVEEVVECGVCGTNSLRINGLEGPYTSVLMDGTPMFGNLASVYGLNGIPSSVIDRIEIVKGPSSTLYGSEAVAGVINIITKEPQRQPLFSADVRTTTHREIYGNLGLSQHVGNWTGFVGVDYAYVNDFHDEVVDGFGDVVGTDRVSVFTKWSKAEKDGRPFFLAAKYLFEDRHNGVFDYLNDRAYKQIRGSNSIYGESIFTNRFEFFGTYPMPFSPHLKLDFSFSHHDQDSYYGSAHYLAQQRIGYVNLLWDKTLGKNNFIAGTTFRHQFYDDSTIATQSNGKNKPDHQIIPGVFAQNEWGPNESFSLLLGARLDQYAGHGPIFAPRLNVKYKTSDWSTLRLNVGTGFRIVNLFTEDHAFVTGQREVELAEALSPERSWNVSLNFNQIHNLMGGQGTLDLDVFYTYFNNKIIPEYEVPGKIIYSNSDGHAISRGLSFSFAQNFIFPLSFNLGITVQYVTQTERNEDGLFEKTAIEFAPRFSSNGTLNYRWRKKGLMAAWTFNLTGPMYLPKVFDLDENGNPLSTARPTKSETWSRHTIQLTKSFKKSKMEIYGGVENIFNYRQPISPLVGINDPKAPVGFSPYFDTVYAYAPLSGREFYLGVRWEIDRKKNKI